MSVKSNLASGRQKLGVNNRQLDASFSAYAALNSCVQVINQTLPLT